jgi:hypothetical protein
MRWNRIEPKKKQKMELLHLATTFFSLTCMLVSLFYYYYYFFFFGVGVNVLVLGYIVLVILE